MKDGKTSWNQQDADEWMTGFSVPLKVLVATWDSSEKTGGCNVFLEKSISVANC